MIHCLLVLSLQLSSCSASWSPTRTLGRTPQEAPRSSRGLSLPTLQIVLGREVIVHVGLSLPPPRLLRQVSHVLWPQGVRAPMPSVSPPLVLQDLLVECLMVNPTRVPACSRTQGITWRSSIQGLGVTLQWGCGASTKRALVQRSPVQHFLTSTPGACMWLRPPCS